MRQRRTTRRFVARKKRRVPVTAILCAVGIVGIVIAFPMVLAAVSPADEAPAPLVTETVVLAEPAPEAVVVIVSAEPPVREEPEVPPEISSAEPDPEPEPAASPDPEPPPVARVEIPRLSPLVVRLMEGFEGGELEGRRKAGLVAVTAEGLSVRDGSSTVAVAWADVAPELFHDLVSELELDGSLQVALARYCYRHSLRLQGDRQLHAYRQADRAGRKGKVDALLAELRGEPLPEEGYTWDPASGYEHPRRRHNRRARERAVKLCSGASGIARSADARRLDRNLKRLRELIQDASLTAETREAVCASVRAALHEHRDLRFAKLQRAAAKTRPNLSPIVRDVEAARRDALRVIRDIRLYPDENHGAAGQPQVDRAVQGLRELWNGEGFSMLLPRKVAEEIRAIRALDAEVAPEFGGAPTERETAQLQSFVEKIHAYIRDAIQAAASKRLRNASNAVRKHNGEAFTVPEGVPKEIREHVRILNAYRCMLGLSELRLDTRLCRAAQVHSVNMAGEGRIWHDGSDGTPSKRAGKYGYSGGVGENVAMGCPTPQAAFDGWYTSSGHHRNMISNSYTIIGVGVKNGYWTQVFGSGSAVAK